MPALIIKPRLILVANMDHLGWGQIIKPRLILVANMDHLGWNKTSNQQQQMLIQNLNRIVSRRKLRQGRSCIAPQTVVHARMKYEKEKTKKGREACVWKDVKKEIPTSYV